MNGNISAVLTLGFGSWGSVNLTLTLGYGIGEAAAPRSANSWPDLHGPDNSFRELSGPDNSFRDLSGGE